MATASISKPLPSASASASASALRSEGKRISRIVFIALLLDILSFTIILPLLPRSLEAYKAREGADSSTLLGWTLQHVTQLRELILANAGARASRFLQQGARADLVLLGGLLGSVYSLLQCIVAPIIGRPRIGNIVWTVLWVFSGSFESFLAARIIAGLSEGNVQLSTTIIADVTDPQTRSHGMALVGIAFAVGFTIGPSIGAFFSRMNIESQATTTFGYAPFAVAAVFSLALLLTESLYLYFKLPETKNFNSQRNITSASADSAVAALDSGNEEPLQSQLQPQPGARLMQERQKTKSILRQLNYVHFAYLFFFSGMEYTLTFLTHDRFNFSNAQQGKLLGFIGITSTLLQGGYVRRRQILVAQGMAGCTLGLLSIALCCIKADAKDMLRPSWWLWAGALGFAVASATVVNCLNSMVSLVGADDGSTGRRLGDFRSAGQIGRALGPMFSCTLYWLAGASTCYMVGAVAVAAITLAFVSVIPASTVMHSSGLKKSQ
ncbi:major facilitator superfamily domain-containing protein [Kickxella alabastrina]|uniref:major facilitator superfamily domain-containing protein n=1 Tax=Kickxella alabastrina TaxID=61397 RepID=UPI00221E6CB7|nr:major facilitator superfamily domain-containing protein [Kickxella alabastrina]KAI7827714.1 major facilitator superfamily domain-containing protein [Kickxella alabastrina]